MTNLHAAFPLDALSFVLSALCIARLNVTPLAPKRGAAPLNVLHNLRDGLGFVRGTPVPRSLVLVFVPVFVDYGLTNSLVLPFVKGALGGNEFHYSLMEAMFAVGFVVGSLIMANLADRLHAGQWIAISILGMGVFTAGMAQARHVWVAIACSTMIGLLNAPSYLGRQLLIQHTTPRETRGRVSSVFFVLRDTGFMIGMAAAGLADVFDVRLLMLILAAGLLSIGSLALILPGLGQRSAEWRRMLAMLRAGPEGHAALGLGRVRMFPISTACVCTCRRCRIGRASCGRIWRDVRAFSTWSPVRRSCDKMSEPIWPILFWPDGPSRFEGMAGKNVF